MNAPDRLNAVLVPADKRKVAYVADAKMPNAAVFVLQREDHTLGHLLKMELLRDPLVHFAAYRHPHPLDNHIELKVQAASSARSPAKALVDASQRLAAEFRLLRVTASEQVRAAATAAAADDME